MKTELVNFVNSLSPEVFSYNLELDEGLYIFVDIDEEGKLLGFKKGLHKKKEEKNKDEKKKQEPKLEGQLELLFIDQSPADSAHQSEAEMSQELSLEDWEKCLAIQGNVKPVSPAKIFNPDKKIFGASCSGFVLSFNKKNLYDKKVLRKEEIDVSLVQYFKGAEKYIKAEHENHVIWFEKFRSFCLKDLMNFLLKTPEYTEAKELFKVNVFLKDPEIADYQLLYEPYMAISVFNKEKDELKIENVIYNVADGLSNFNASKIFLKHQTAPFEFNQRVSGEDAKAIWQFFNIRGRLLPNPLPIFIDKKELNDKVVRIISEDKKIGYKEILKKIFDSPQYQGDLGNYYLLFFLKGEIIDLDFVPSFQYEIKDMIIEEVFTLGGKQQKVISNIFEFEREIANRMLNGQLVSDTKDGGLWLRYFGDVEFKPQYMTHNTYNQLLKYRKAFYDYIYKAKREAIRSDMFHDIMLKGVLDDLKADEYKDRRHSQYQSVREKLNIWFSLYNYFDSNRKQDKTMASRISEHREMMQKLTKGEIHLQNDDDFAFATGQVIAYLYSKSESSDRSYSRLEPFLQKVNCVKLQEAIHHAFDSYKHKSFSNNFKRPFADVMDYKTEENVQKLMPVILAGFFSDNLLFADKEVEESSEISNS